MARTLIAGCGYVGSALAERLLARGQRVWGLRRSTAPLPEGVECIQADLAEAGSLAEGSLADVVVIDPVRKWHYDPAKGYSKSQNSPWAGCDLEGRVLHTLVGGVPVFDAERGVLV